MRKNQEQRSLKPEKTTPSGEPSMSLMSLEEKREWYGRMYEENLPKTVSLLRSKNEPLAYEIAQAAWVNGWVKLHLYRGEAQLKTWINRIALNTSLMSLRRKNLFKMPLIESVDNLEVRCGNSIGFDSGVDVITQLNEVLAAIPEKYADILRARMYGTSKVSNVDHLRALLRARCFFLSKKESQELMQRSVYGHINRKSRSKSASAA